MTSACQLMDQVGPNRSFAIELSAGFPKVRTRLPSTGHIKALIVPVDFPNVNGQDNPAVFLGPLPTTCATSTSHRNDIVAMTEALHSPWLRVSALNTGRYSQGN